MLMSSLETVGKELSRALRIGQWVPAGIGILLVTLVLLFVVTSTENPLVTMFKGGIALLLSLGMVVVWSRYLAGTKIADAYTDLIVAWTVLGLVAMTIMNAWFRVVTLLFGVVEWQVATLTTLAAGGFGGTIIGIYSAQSRQQQAEREQALADYQEVFDKAEVGIVLTDPEEGTISEVNRRYAEMTGYDNEELQGMSIEDVSVDDPAFDQAAAMEKIQQVLEGEPQQFDWPIKRKDGGHLWVEVALKRTTIGGEERLLAFIRDVSERKQFENRLRALSDILIDLASAETSEDITQFAVDTIADVLDKPLAVVWEYDADAEILVPCGANEQALTRLAAEDHEGPPPMREGTVEMTAFRRGETMVLDDYASRDDAGAPIPLETVLLAPLGEYGLLGVGTHEHNGINEIDRYAVNILRRSVRVNLERVQREQTLETLHEVTREMLRVEEKQEVAEIAVDTAQAVLDYPITAIWLADSAGTTLAPVAATSEARALFGTLPTYTVEDESFSWRAFETGEMQVYDDVTTHAAAHNPDTPVRSELVVPLGDAGVINIGATEACAFDDADMALTRLLATNTEVALELVEGKLRLERQANQLEFFNSILRHDVLNGMTVIRARADMLADELDGEQQTYAETVVEWSDDITDIAQRVRRVIQTLTSPERTRDLRPIEISSLVRDEVSRLRTTHSAVEFETDVPEGAAVRGDELLSDVIGNVLTNSVEHNDHEGLEITTTVEETDNTVMVRIADNGSGIPDERKESIFRRGETGHAKETGSGFGLFFVDAMISEYGGDIWVEDNESGGATFVIELPKPEAVVQEQWPERTSPGGTNE